MELFGKVAVVTGASSGIGRETALRLARDGMQVVAVARRRERLEEVQRAQPGIAAHVADVTDMAQVDGLAAWVDERYGACHALVCNAGLGGERFAGRESVDDVLHTMDVNFFGTVRCMGAFRDLLLRSAPSRVVNVASVAGKVGIGPAGYAASKSAVVGFSEAVGLDWGAEGVTVCQLNPGFIKTEGFTQEQVLRTPAARIVGEPGIVADAIAEVIRSGATERTVPRFYRAVPVLRHIAAPLFWRVAARLPRARGHRN